MQKFAFGAICVLFMQLSMLALVFPVHEAHAQYFKGQPFQPYPRPMEAPFASWQDADGNATSMLQYKGDVLLINFWATWCGPCVIEMPDLDALQKKYQAAGLKVLAISIDEEGVGKVHEFYRKNNLQHLEVFNDSDGSSASAFNVKSLPTSFLVDHEGKAIGMVNGFARWEKPEYEKYIQHALKRRAADVAEEAAPFGGGRQVLGVQ